jgi:hypothetical protein
VTIGTVPASFRTSTSRAGLTEVRNKRSEFLPGIVSLNEFQSLGAPKMAREQMVMSVSEDSESEVITVRDIDAIIELEETFVVERPVRNRARGEFVKDFGGERIITEGSSDVKPELCFIHN